MYHCILYCNQTKIRNICQCFFMKINWIRDALFKFLLQNILYFYLLISKIFYDINY